MVYSVWYIPHSLMSFKEELKKTLFTGLADIAQERRDEFDQNVAKLVGPKQCKLKKAWECLYQ